MTNRSNPKRGKALLGSAILLAALAACLLILFGGHIGELLERPRKLTNRQIIKIVEENSQGKVISMTFLPGPTKFGDSHVPNLFDGTAEICTQRCREAFYFYRTRDGEVKVVPEFSGILGGCMGNCKLNEITHSPRIMNGFGQALDLDSAP